MALTRGSLPSSVYWRRRLVVLTLALLLVVVIAKLLGLGSDGSSGHAATDVAADASPTVTVTVSPSGSSAPPQTWRGQHSNATAPTSTALPTPSGDCAPSDLKVTPTVTNAYAASPVTVMLQLQTEESPACTWHASSDSLQVRISGAGGATVWSTVDCPQAVPAADLTVYRDTPTNFPLTWLGHRSDDSCSVHTPWARAGTYRVVAAALGGEPTEATFELAVPGSTPTPTTSAAPSGSASTSASPSDSPSATGTDGRTTAGSDSTPLLR
ncbi:hypothetical protein [Nocardioides sp. KR10-350]|uniref:hypothetical protein n=1 Tax=Nocardioides cheoyonin TaxID=3156615 RepID=UPI0032B593D7